MIVVKKHNLRNKNKNISNSPVGIKETKANKSEYPAAE